MAKKEKTKEIRLNIDNLIPDDKNANKGTDYGQEIIEKSLSELGFGRSILLDKDNRVIAGNKTLKGSKSVGINNVRVIETKGDEIIAVKRTDISLDEKKGRELAIADNSTSAVNLSWDIDNLQDLQENYNIDLSEWGVNIAEQESSEEENNNYSRKIEAPIYEPKGEKPKITELFDNSTTQQLLNEIQQSDIEQEEKDFLIKAAQRHTVFNYEKIAEYYAHADKDMQSLMENSALVIIDYNKAIEKGFIKLTKVLTEANLEDNE